MAEKSNFLRNLPQISEPGLSANVSELFKKGIKAYKNLDIDGAIEIFNNIIATNPEMVEAHINLGNFYFKLKNIDESIKCWKTALSLDPNKVICYLHIGNAFFAKGKVEEAVDMWIKLISVAPDQPTALMNLGVAYEQKNKMIESFMYYERFIKYGANQNSAFSVQVVKKVAQAREIASSYLYLAIKAQNKGNFKKALACYSKAIQTYPLVTTAYINVGSICYKADKMESAVKYWIKAVKLGYFDDNILCNLGVAYDKLEKYSYALCFYSKYLNASGKDTLDSSAIRERTEKVKKYVDKHPESIKKHLEKAEAFFGKREYFDAILEYENYSILNPSQLEQMKNKISEVKDLITPERKAARLAFEVANKLFDNGNYEKAADVFKKQIFFEPKGENSKVAYKKIAECVNLITKGKWH